MLKDQNSLTLISRNNPEIDRFKHHKADITKDDLPETEHSIEALVYLPGSINLKPFKMPQEENFKNDFEINLLGLSGL